jgi:regulatory protein
MFDDARKNALKLLEKKDYTRRQIRDKLIKKGFPNDIIDKIIIWLEERRLIDDKRFAENLIFFKEKKGYGKRRIIKDLFLRGIGEDTIQDVIKKIDFSKEVERAEKVLQKKEKTIKIDDKILLKKKLLQYLLQRGFEWEVVKEVWGKR